MYIPDDSCLKVQLLRDYHDAPQYTLVFTAPTMT